MISSFGSMIAKRLSLAPADSVASIKERPEVNDASNMIGAGTLATRAVAALRLMFVGDSLAMPVHWFYDVREIRRAFSPNGVMNLEAAPKYHPSSIMNLHSTTQGGRTASSSGKHQREIVGEVILKGRRHLWGQQNQHYHTGMKAGDNTLNLQCARVLMRSISSNHGEYNADSALNDYIAFMTSDPPQYKDTYAESYHRGFFANLELGKPRDQCGAVTHDTPSIGGLVSIGPLAIALLLQTIARDGISAEDKVRPLSPSQLEEIQRICRKHLFLTHPDAGLGSVADQYVAFLADLLLRHEDDPTEIITRYAGSVIGTKTIQGLLRREDVNVIGGTYSPACYISGAWPSVVYLAAKYSNDPSSGLLANANVGGDNCHRGAVLGVLYGLASKEADVAGDRTLLMFDKLVDARDIQSEIDELLRNTIGKMRTEIPAKTEEKSRGAVPSSCM